VSVAAAVLATVAAVMLATTPSSRGRLRSLRQEDPSPPATARRRSALLTPRSAACAVAGLGTALTVTGRLGVLLGGAVAVAAWVVTGRLEPAAVRQRREALAAALPLGVDLLAACLLVGRPPAEALQVVARAVGGPLADELGVVAARLALGADPVAVWRQVAGGGLAPLGRTMARSLETGAPAAEALTRLADDLRRERRTLTDQAARSVGVRAAAPLGLCFLPAFVLVGIVPSIVSAFGALRLF
jgi:Flp pilus assembly protein TadB